MKRMNVETSGTDRVYWWEDVCIIGRRFSLDRWPTPWQRGFWVDRGGDYTAIGFGVAILHIRRVR
jgi:hypothetical protein